VIIFGVLASVQSRRGLEICAYAERVIAAFERVMCALFKSRRFSLRLKYDVAAKIYWIAAR